MIEGVRARAFRLTSYTFSSRIAGSALVLDLARFRRGAEEHDRYVFVWGAGRSPLLRPVVKTSVSSLKRGQLEVAGPGLRVSLAFQPRGRPRPLRPRPTSTDLGTELLGVNGCFGRGGLSQPGRVVGRFSWKVGPRYFRTIRFRSARAHIDRLLAQPCRHPPVRSTAVLWDYMGESCGVEHLRVWRTVKGATWLSMFPCGGGRWMRGPLPNNAFTYAGDGTWAEVRVSHPWVSGAVRVSGRPVASTEAGQFVVVSEQWTGRIIASFGASSWPEPDTGLGGFMVPLPAPR